MSRYPYVILFLVISFTYGQDTTIQTSDPKIEADIDRMLGRMSLTEKVGQTAQRGKSSRVKDIPEDLKQAVREGRVGSLLNITKPEQVKELQKIAIEESPSKIPLLFARDVIHGHKTIFPIPLGQAASWNPKLVEAGSRIAAKEATSVGIKWTFAPMLDIARDPRWGRIAESPGEDPFLASALAKAYVRGFQGNSLSDPDSMLACAKHFAGYGAAEGGRDYNTTSIPVSELYNTYLPPFETASREGVATFMTGFNALNGVPVSANPFLLRNVLKEKWNFDGFVVSDWESVKEIIAHGLATDEKHAAQLAAAAGCDMEMTSTTYESFLEELIKENVISENLLDDMVRRILRIKYRAGLFETPYFEAKTQPYEKAHLAKAKEAVIQSCVLLKNDNRALPLRGSTSKIAVIGPLADAPHEQLGTWTFDGDKTHSVTPLTSLIEFYGKKQILYTPGLSYSRDRSDQGFDKATEVAKQSDIVLFFGGEEAILSGEAHSRADLSLPGAQAALIEKLSLLNKPIVLVLMAGRPITLEGVINKVDALLMCWHPGTMAGPAITDLLNGTMSPSGKLPISWPKTAGQVPIYYNHLNTGRPVNPEAYVGIEDIPVGAWQSSLGNTSHYLDAGYQPLFPFGFGLSYTSFLYSETQIIQNTISKGEKLIASCTLTNTGNKKGREVVQLYLRDRVASIVRPVRELKGFTSVTLEPGTSQDVSFEITEEMLQFYHPDQGWVVEPGRFEVWIAPNAAEGQKQSFSYK